MSPLQHSASADDLFLHAQHMKSSESCESESTASSSADEEAHSDEELDLDHSSVAVHPDPEGAVGSGPVPVELAFSASAGAFVYQMGIAAYLQEHFDLSNCHFSGCSGGSWAATLLASGTSVRRAWGVIRKTQNRLVPENASWYTGYGLYGRIVEETILDLWKDDADVHERVQAKRLSIAVTKFPSLKAETHTAWDSLEDLMKSILASAMIPFALTGRPCISHRGQWYVDGGITNFKGIACDQYSTWRDLYFHSAQTVLDTVRATTTKVSDYFFPSLTKPVAKLINGLLPQLESPHDAIAPRLTTGEKPVGARDPTSTTARPRLIFKPWTWRAMPVTSYHLSVDIQTHQRRFDLGYEDARLHHHELEALLPSLRLA
ncbi:hypothetical protein P43SY_001254 [Pythium insidiosum]|uniref:PNPLA domain-containing protein n=1 Tax=Pythium insidiosum TaxID=114742 RepID=A0AAD5Q6C6_PYTIN|nr:hypothetical protein P43SY_001254 [Pythium insidiosum]